MENKERIRSRLAISVSSRSTVAWETEGAPEGQLWSKMEQVGSTLEKHHARSLNGHTKMKHANMKSLIESCPWIGDHSPPEHSAGEGNAADGKIVELSWSEDDRRSYATSPHGGSLAMGTL